MNRCGVIIPRIRTRNGNICCIVCADINVWDSFTSMPSWCNRNRDGCRRWLCSWSQLRMWNCPSRGCMVWTESMPPICSNRDRMPAGTVSIMSNMWISTSMVVPIEQFDLFIGCLEYWDYYSSAYMTCRAKDQNYLWWWLLWCGMLCLPFWFPLDEVLLPIVRSGTIGEDNDLTATE